MERDHSDAIRRSAPSARASTVRALARLRAQAAAPRPGGAAGRRRRARGVASATAVALLAVAVVAALVVLGGPPPGTPSPDTPSPDVAAPAPASRGAAAGAAAPQSRYDAFVDDLEQAIHGGTRCRLPAAGRRITRAKLRLHRMEGWTIAEGGGIHGDGFSAERPCVSLYFDRSRRVVTLVPMTR